MIFIISSCHEDVINLDLNEFESKIVVEGRIGSYPGPYTIKISKTTRLSNKDDVKPVTGAHVAISDDQGRAELLIEESEGIYLTNSTQGRNGRTYTLTIETEGETYTASSTMQRTVLIQDISFEKKSPDDIYYNLVLSMDNLADTPEYCLIDIYRNEFLHSSHLYSDRFAEDQDVILDELDTYFVPADIVHIVVLSIDENVYEFYRSLDPLQDIFYDMDDPFAAGTLYNPTSNISNGALGYFSAHSVRTYETVVAWEL